MEGWISRTGVRVSNAEHRTLLYYSCEAHILTVSAKISAFRQRLFENAEKGVAFFQLSSKQNTKSLAFHLKRYIS